MRPNFSVIVPDEYNTNTDVEDMTALDLLKLFGPSQSGVWKLETPEGGVGITAKDDSTFTVTGTERGVDIVVTFINDNK